MGSQIYLCPPLGTLVTALFAMFRKFQVRMELKLHCFLLLFLM